MTLAKKIFSNTLWLSLGEFTKLALSSVIVIFLARYLGDVRYGQYVFAVSLTQLLAVFAEAGFMNYLVNEFSRNPDKVKKYFNNALTLKILINILYFGLLYVILFFLDKPQEIKILVYLAGGVVVAETFSMVFYALARVKEKMIYEGILKTILGIVNFGFILAVILTQGDLPQVFQAMLASNFLILLVTIIVIYRKFEFFKLSFDLKIWPVIIKGVGPFALSVVFISIYYYLDQVMLSYFKGDAVTGWYGAIYKILLIMLTLGSLYYQTIFPTISKLYLRSKTELSNILTQSLKIMILFFLPATFAITVLARPIIELVYGSQYLGGVLALQILIWTMLIINISCAYGNTLLACNKKGIYTLGVGLGALFNLIANFLLIPKYSLEGAAVATLLSELFVFIFMYFNFQQKLFKLSYFKYLLKPLIASLIMTTVLILFSGLNLFMLIILGLFTYLLVLFIVKGIDQEDLAIFKKALWTKN